MSTLRVGFSASAPDTRSMRVPLEVIDAGMRTIRQLPAPLSTFVEISVPPGQYLVRALLPSGEIVAAQAVADRSDDLVEVRLGPERPSPRETLTVPYLREWALHIGREPTESVADFRPVVAPLGGVWARLVIHDPLVGSRFRILSRWSGLGADRLMRIDRTVAVDDPQLVCAIEWNPEQFGPREEVGQLWLQIGADNAPTRFTAVPPVPAGQVARVLIVRRATFDGDGDPLAVVSGGGNPSAEALLGYLANGAFAAARLVGSEVLDEAEQLLFEKNRDPASAAIGGYFLLRAARMERLHEWTRNLDQRFPWFPDGAVVRAWHLLQRPEPDVIGARDRLVAAAGRGVPLFTQGLRLLFDGLHLLDLRTRQQTGDADPEVTAALEGIRPYAAAADWQSATTTFYGADPERPDVPGAVGAPDPFSASRTVIVPPQQQAWHSSRPTPSSVPTNRRLPKGDIRRRQRGRTFGGTVESSEPDVRPDVESFEADIRPYIVGSTDE